MENEVRHLPESCAIGVADTAGALIIRRGEPGFSFFRSVVSNEWNAAYSITPAQVSAMLLGAVTGWDAPTIDPDLFDTAGQFIVKLDEVGRCAFWCAMKGLSGEADSDHRLPPQLSAEGRQYIRDQRLAFTAIVRFRNRLLLVQKSARDAFGE